MKRILSVLCVAALVLTFVHGVALATAQNQTSAPPEDGFSLNVDGNVIQFIRNGVVEGSYEVSPSSNVLIHTDKDGDLLVLITQPDGKQRNITLRKQTSLSISGNAAEIGGFELDKSLSKDVRIEIQEDAFIPALQVNSSTKDLYVKGDVETLNVAGTAKVSLSSESKVGTLRVTNNRASVKAENGSTVQKAMSVKASAVSGIKAVAKLADSTGRTSGRSRNSSSSSSSKTTSSKPPQSYQPTAPVVPGVPDAPDNPSDITIVNVYPTTQNVRIELSRAVELDRSAFYISCPTGKDMTILSVETVSGADKNRVYILKTAHYLDNTYIATVTLPSGKKIEKEFVTNSLLPDISDIQSKRVSKDTAEVTFISDSAGMVYYMAVPNGKARGAIASSAPQSAEDIKRGGASMTVYGGLNQIELTGLAENTAYTVYLAAADSSGNELSGMLPSVSIPSEAAASPDTGEIHITKVEQIDNVGFRVVLSKPTSQKLDASAFYAKCPAQAALHLGRAETTDNQTYDVYLQDGWFYLPKNHYNVKVTFPDGTTAEGSFYADTYPAIGTITGKRVNGIVTVTFSSDKPGKIYYGTTTSFEEKPRDVEAVIASGTEHPLYAGTNEITIENVPADHMQFYMVAVDNKGNMAAFVEGGQITNAVAPPDSGTVSNEILDIQADEGSSTIYVTFREEVNFASMDYRFFDFTVYSGGSENKLSVFTISGGENTLNSKVLTLGMREPMPAGEYKMTVYLPPDNFKVEKNFTVTAKQAASFAMDEDVFTDPASVPEEPFRSLPLFNEKTEDQAGSSSSQEESSQTEVSSSSEDETEMSSVPESDTESEAESQADVTSSEEDTPPADIPQEDVDPAA